MKLSIEWLKDFVDLSVPLKTFADELTLSGSKVEAVHDPLSEITHVVVGQILSREAHPEADRLQICQVNVGEEQALQIVTAAKNIEVGDKVPVALVGAKLAGGIEIKKGKLRGVVSEGMFCSYHELGVDKTLFPEAAEDGIFLLPQHFPLGSLVLKELGVSDASVEFEITSNRPDCFHVEGLARETAITLNEDFAIYQPYVKAFHEKKDFLSSELLQVENLAPSFCTTYLACCIKNVRIAPSPFWLQKRLLKSGVRPINNMVDITNYVMLELGQPMHAFDAKEICGNKLYIRPAKEGETFTSLEEKEYVLRSTDHVIADEEKVLALAGVMGGQNSGVKEDTQEVVFEVAFFAPEKVRHTSSFVGLRTESSSRFERLVDKTQAKRCLLRACELVESLDIGSVASDFIQIETEAFVPRTLEISLSKINRFLGTELSEAFMLSLFRSLEIKVLEQKEDKVWLEIPSFRPDLEGFADIAEEVARFYGYNKITPSLMKGAENTQGGRSLAQQKLLEMKNYLVHQGYYEAYANTLSSPQTKEKIDAFLPQNFAKNQKPVVIKNAAIESSQLRVSLLPDMLNALSLNANRQAKTARLFEVGKVYWDEGKDCLAKEENKLLFAAFDQQYGKHKKGELFYEGKYLVEQLHTLLGLSVKVEKENAQNLKEEATLSLLHPYRRACLYVQGVCVGVIGYVHPKVLEIFDAPAYVMVAELNLDFLLSKISIAKAQKALPRFPSTSRDLALIVEEEVSVGDVLKCMKKEIKQYLEEIHLFDVYRSETLGANKKSLAFELVFRSEQSTLTDAEILPWMQKLETALEKQFSAKVRK